MPFINDETGARPTTLEKTAMLVIPSTYRFEVTDPNSEIYCMEMVGEDFCDFFGIYPGCAAEQGRDVIAGYIVEFSRLVDLDVGGVLWDFMDNWIVKRVQ